MRKILTVADRMTRTPHVIDAEQSMKAAHDLMRKHRIRHLPVVQGRKLVGLVSMRDLHLLETLPDVDMREVRVNEAMSPEVYAVAPGTPLKRVVKKMAAGKLGSAVVVDGGNIVGVFTTVDALETLAAVLPR